ncbi:MAG: NAD(P)H-binding protein, partial [Myxococcota bacterium]
MTTFLVLGSTGTVGAHLSQLLVNAGHTVRGATRTPAQHPIAGVEAIPFDYSDPGTFAAALDGVERLFLLTPPGYADAAALLNPFLTEAFTAGLERIVLMTAQGVEHNDAIPLRQVELTLEASGTPFVHLRPSWFSQNFHTFWGHGLRQHNTLALPAGDARVGFIDARDIAAAAAGALTREDIALDRGYELTGPEAITHAEAAVHLSRALERTITYQNIDDDAFRAQLAPSGLPDAYIDLLVGLFASVRAGAAASVTHDVKLLSGSEPRSVATYALDHR